MFSRGVKGGGLARRKDTRAQPHSQSRSGPVLAQEWGGLGPTVRAVLMRTTCVGGVPRMCDTRVIRRVVHHATVARVPPANVSVGLRRRRSRAACVSFSERRLSLLRVEVYEALATATGEIRVWLDYSNREY